MNWTVEQITVNGQQQTYYSRSVDSSFRFESASAVSLRRYHSAFGRSLHLTTGVLFSRVLTGQLYPVVAYYAGPDKPTITSKTFKQYAAHTGVALWYNTSTMTVARLSGTPKSPSWDFDAYSVFPRLTVNARTGLYETQYVTAEELVHLYEEANTEGGLPPVDPPVSFDELLRQMHDED